MNINRELRVLGTALAILGLPGTCPTLLNGQSATDKATAGKVDSGATTQATPRNAEATVRQSQLAADSDRLYKMAEELKTEVAKSNKDILSVAVVKKADDIEKLARSLKERLKSE